MSHGKIAKGIRYIPNVQEPKLRPRTNKELEQRIITILGIDAMRNPDTNTRGSITPLQVSKQVPDLVLHSFDDIQNTMYNMVNKKLLHIIKQNYERVGTVESEQEETQFQISVDGIIRFRKSLRPIARLAIKHEEKYQAIVEQTNGNPEVKAELKELPAKIKDSIGGYSKLKAELKTIPKKIMLRIENKAYNYCADIVMRYGPVKVGIFIKSFIFPEDVGAGIDVG